MASIFSLNARHALSTLSANVNPPTSKTSILTSGTQAIGSEIPHKMAPASLSSLAHQKDQVSLPHQAGLDSKEWATGITEEEDRPSKRQRRGVGGLEGEDAPQEPLLADVRIQGLVESETCGAGDQINIHSSFNSIFLLADSISRSPSASPASSFDFNSSALNDSQNTTMTEPDDIHQLSFSRPAARKLTKEEAREKAEALRLRLRLANYRVRTNQITVPLKDLQVRTMTSPKIPLPLGTFSSWKTAHSPSSSFNRVSTSKPAQTNTSLNIPSSPPSFFDTTPSTAPTKEQSADTSFSAAKTHRDQIIQPSMPKINTSNSNDETLRISIDERKVATAGLLSLMGQRQL